MSSGALVGSLTLSEALAGRLYSTAPRTNGPLRDPAATRPRVGRAVRPRHARCVRRRRPSASSSIHDDAGAEYTDRRRRPQPCIRRSRRLAAATGRVRHGLKRPFRSPPRRAPRGVAARTLLRAARIAGIADPDGSDRGGRRLRQGPEDAETRGSRTALSGRGRSNPRDAAGSRRPAASPRDRDAAPPRDSLRSDRSRRRPASRAS